MTLYSWFHFKVILTYETYLVLVWIVDVLIKYVEFIIWLSKYTLAYYQWLEQLLLVRPITSLMYPETRWFICCGSMRMQRFARFGAAVAIFLFLAINVINFLFLTLVITFSCIINCLTLCNRSHVFMVFLIDSTHCM